MSDRLYGRIVSWHVLVGPTRSGYATRCGRRVDTVTRRSEVSDTLPLGEPSCETCARLTLRDTEAPDA